MITSTDPIADMLTRIRNAAAVNRPDVAMPHSNIKEQIVKLLKSSGFVAGYSVSGKVPAKTLSIQINQPDANANITAIRRLSKPGQRMYVRSDKIPMVKRGRGIVIISTSHGLMTGRDAKEKGLGGELLCEVY